MAKSIKREKAEEIVAKFPNTAKSSLAVTLFDQNKLLYKDKEEARSYIRKVTGSYGKHHNKTAAVVDKRPNGIVYNPYELPEETQTKFKPYIIPVKKGNKIVNIADVHMPHQDNVALTAALDYCKTYKPDYIVLDGDIMDAYQVSFHERDPSEKDFKYEVDVMRSFLKMLVDKFPNTKIIYKFGNHELRWERFIWRNAPQIWGFEEFSLANLLGLKALGIEYVGDKRIIKVGKLNIAHGHEFPRSMGSVNPARTFYVKSKTNIIGGHHHQISSYSTRDLNGDSHVAYSQGCLCKLSPEYMPINDWDHGFATIDIMDSNGNFRVNNLKIINGVIY